MVSVLCGVIMFVQNLNWNDLLARRIKPPFVPTIVSFWLYTICRCMCVTFLRNFVVPAFGANLSYHI